MDKPNVAVVGAGPSGLAALKNLREEGFDVTVFEKRNSVGGLWNFTEDPSITSILPSTITNISKYTNAFTDFPILENLPPHLTATQAWEYLKSYADYFDLHKDVKLNTPVSSIERNLEDTQWQVCVKEKGEEKSYIFDRVVVCSGLMSKPLIPHFDGIEKFKGQIIHGQGFKSASDFQDMKVMVVGIGNSAADTAIGLRWHASRIYLSHRHGATILPRMCLGQPLDLRMTRRLYSLKTTLDKHLPSLSNRIMDFELSSMSKKIFGIPDPAWNLLPSPPSPNHHPTISDSLISSFADGTVKPVAGLKGFIGEHTAELTDGTQVEIDVVICCTGYEPDFSIIHNLFNPTKKTVEDIPTIDQSRLYQRIFPPSYAYSLAFMNTYLLSDGAYFTADVVAMAICQIWKRPREFPSIEVMEAEIDTHNSWIARLAEKGSMYSGIVNPGPWFDFLDKAAGAGIGRNLGYGPSGWKFWWKERKLCGIMMKGAMTPWMWRYFEGEKRKAWKGSREAIERTDREVKSLRKREKQQKKVA